MKSVTLFLAGSIDLAVAKNWQTELVAAIGRRDVMILSSGQCGSDTATPREQIERELDGLERADLVAMWFPAETIAPITLLELGLTARGDKLVVGCPDGFWRRHNVEVVCDRFGIPLTRSWSAFVAIVSAKLGQLSER
jgi:hypothetical protein